jgi:hypothetical protein
MLIVNVRATDYHYQIGSASYRKQSKEILIGCNGRHVHEVRRLKDESYCQSDSLWVYTHAGAREHSSFRYLPAWRVYFNVYSWSAPWSFAWSMSPLVHCPENHTHKRRLILDHQYTGMSEQCTTCRDWDWRSLWDPTSFCFYLSTCACKRRIERNEGIISINGRISISHNVRTR